MPHINDLPNEILLKILLHLGSLDDLLHKYIPIIARVSKSWHEAAFELYMFHHRWIYPKTFAAAEFGEFDREFLYHCFKSGLSGHQKRWS